jgi:hypothetical protein
MPCPTKVNLSLEHPIKQGKYKFGTLFQAVFSVKRLIKPCLTALISASLLSCSTSHSQPSKPPYHFFIILAPNNNEQIVLAKKTLLMAKEDGVNGETQVIQPTYSYTVIVLCERNTPDIVLPNTKPSDTNSLDTVTKEAEKSLKLIKDGEQKCIAGPSSLVEISSNLNQAASDKNNEKIIVFLQAPWSRDDVSATTLTTLKSAMDRLAQSGKVERLVLFGVHPNGADKLTQSFQGFNQPGNKRLAIARKSDELVEHLKAVRKDYLE